MKHAVRLLIATIGFVVAASTSASAQNKMVVGYYPSYRHGTYPSAAIAFDNITHLAHSFIWPNSDGSGDLVVPPGFLYAELIHAAHAEDVRVIVVLGGAGNSSGFGPAASDPDTRGQLVENIVSFVQDHGYDGVDLDWEGFTDATYREALIALIQDLDAALETAGPDLTLSMPLGASNWHGAYDVPPVVDNLDWIGIMTYDFHGTWTPHAGHNSPLHTAEGDAEHSSLSESVDYWLDRGVPRGKLLPGMAFYGQKWEGVTTHLGPVSGPISAMTYADIAELIDAEGWEHHWDDHAMVPYLLNDEDEIFVSYDDEASIRHKVEYILDKDLPGVILWEISQDFLPSGEQPLLATAGELLHRPVASEKDSTLPGQVALEGNYPSPFVSSTTIPFELEQAMHVTIEIFDVLGKEVVTLVDAVLPEGRHTTTWVPSAQANGFYVYQMRAGASVQSASLMLIR